MRSLWLASTLLVVMGACVSLDKPAAVKKCLELGDCRDDPTQASGGNTGMTETSATGGQAGTSATEGSITPAGGTTPGGGTTGISSSGGTGGTTRMASTGGTAAGGNAGSSTTTLAGGATTGGITVTGGTASATPTAGTTAAGGSTVTGGATAATSTSASTATGGAAGATSAARTTVAGGSTTTGGAAGSTPTGGTSSAGGSSATGGSSYASSTMAPPPTPTLSSPVCTNETKDATCTGSAVCYKSCGPDSQGQKALICNGSKYVEADCSFSSSTSYECYRLTNVTLCATTPTANTSCSLDPCKPCGGASGTTYYDSGNNAKTGYCVCTKGKWSCASTTAWPCPDHTGC